MELKGRLQAIADKVPACNILADIGTDHAYIPIFAIEKSICKKAVATDVKPGPVRIAQRNIERFGFEKHIDTRLGDGLVPLMENEAEVIVIAGMGGILIQEILEKSLKTAQSAQILVLQPMNMVEVLRKWLNDNGFDIIDENLVEETNKIYNILVVKWIGKTEPVDAFRLYIGQRLLGRNDALFKRYALRKLKLLNNRINGLQNAVKQQAGVIQLLEIRDRLQEIINNIDRGGSHEC